MPDHPTTRALHIRPPEMWHGSLPSLFLAGGISGTAPWQDRLVTMLADTPWAFINPRQPRYGDSPEAARAQIAWEFHYFRTATACLFWFPPETLCPIALFELGGMVRTTLPLFVGVHPNYARRLDIIEQLQLARPDVQVVDSLDALAGQIRLHNQKGQVPCGT